MLPYIPSDCDCEGIKECDCAQPLDGIFEVNKDNTASIKPQAPALIIVDDVYKIQTLNTVKAATVTPNAVTDIKALIAQHKPISYLVMIGLVWWLLGKK